MPLELGLLQHFLKSLNNRQCDLRGCNKVIDVAIHIVTVINIIIIAD